MADVPYTRFARKELILRDELAIDRTVLANERTLLAYVRTALTLLITGVTFIHFIESGAPRILGLLFVPAGVIVGAFGAWRCRRMQAGIRALRSSPASGTPAE
jgi:putative membrane protein